jgi:hypothetical protein
VTIDDVFNEVCTTIHDQNQQLSPSERVSARHHPADKGKENNSIKSSRTEKKR